MTNRKSTKRALLGSVVAMVLCLAMLVGATFDVVHRHRKHGCQQDPRR